MGKVSAYPTLTSELARAGIRKSTVAKVAGISEKALYNKLYGLAPFTWGEVKAIRDGLFPHLTCEELFK